MKKIPTFIFLAIISLGLISETLAEKDSPNYRQDTVPLRDTIPPPFEEPEKGVVSGIVKDAVGNPLLGATIQIKGTGTGAISGDSGNYTTAIPDDPNGVVLVFSFLGFKSKEVMLGNQTSKDVTLVSDEQQLDEVVVSGPPLQRKY